MHRKILIPLDGSDFAETALPLALSVAEHTRGELQLVTAVPTLPPLVPAAETEGPVRGWFEEEIVRASEYLEEAHRRVAAATDVPVHTRVVSGDPVQSLDERIRKTGAELVVMTTHGRGFVERVWLGSVADGLVRRAPCPILLQRLDEGEDTAVDLASRPSFRRVLVPLDGSAEAEAVLPSAVAMAVAFDAQVSILHVIGEGTPDRSTEPGGGAQESGASSRAEADRLTAGLRNAVERVRAEGPEAELEMVDDGGAGEAILEARRRLGADLVALSTRGRGGVARLVLGSVADRVIRSGSVPVLVHRRP